MVSAEPTIDLQHPNVRPPIIRPFDIHPLRLALYYRLLNRVVFFVPNFEYLDWHHVVIKLLLFTHTQAHPHLNPFNLKNKTWKKSTQRNETHGQQIRNEETK